jgi:hypothetical protein
VCRTAVGAACDAAAASLPPRLHFDRACSQLCAWPVCAAAVASAVLMFVPSSGAACVGDCCLCLSVAPCDCCHRTAFCLLCVCDATGCLRGHGDAAHARVDRCGGPCVAMCATDLSGSLVQAENDLRTLENVVANIERNRSKFAHVDDRELGSRKEALSGMKARLTNMRAQMTAKKAKMDADKKKVCVCSVCWVGCVGARVCVLVRCVVWCGVGVVALRCVSMSSSHWSAASQHRALLTQMLLSQVERDRTSLRPTSKYDSANDSYIEDQRQRQQMIIKQQV